MLFRSAQIEHLQENIEKARKELEELASALTDKSKELEGYKRELREFMLTDVQ